MRFYHILNEVLKFAYAKRSALGDEYDSQTDKNFEIEKVRENLHLVFDRKSPLVVESHPFSGICRRNPTTYQRRSNSTTFILRCEIRSANRSSKRSIGLIELHCRFFRSRNESLFSRRCCRKCCCCDQYHQY